MGSQLVYRSSDRRAPAAGSSLSCLAFSQARTGSLFFFWLLVTLLVLFDLAGAALRMVLTTLVAALLVLLAPLEPFEAWEALGTFAFLGFLAFLARVTFLVVAVFFTCTTAFLPRVFVVFAAATFLLPGLFSSASSTTTTFFSSVAAGFALFTFFAGILVDCAVASAAELRLRLLLFFVFVFSRAFGSAFSPRALSEGRLCLLGRSTCTGVVVARLDADVDDDVDDLFLFF